MKRISIFLLIFVVSSLGFFAYGQTINDSNVRLRQFPNLSSAILDVLQINEPVKVYRKTPQKMTIGSDSFCWYYVQAKQKYGWIYGKYISKISDESINIQQYGENFSFIDYDFTKGTFVSIGNDGIKKEISSPHSFSLNDKMVVWFSPFDVRNPGGTALGSDLIIKKPNGQISILSMEKDKIDWYESEVGFIQITKNGRYLLIDEGTWHVRNMDILNLDSSIIEASGSYTSNMKKANDENTIFLINQATTITGFTAAYKYLTENKTRNILDEGSLGGIAKYELIKKDWMNESTTFYFGDLKRFNLETGKMESVSKVLYYASVE